MADADREFIDPAPIFQNSSLILYTLIKWVTHNNE